MPGWLLFALLSAFFAALTAIFAKAGLKAVDSDLATAIRTAIVLFITWAVVFIKGNVSAVSTLSKNNWLYLTLSALATGASWLFYYKALQMGKTSEVAAIDKGSLVFTILLSFLFLKEPMTARILIGAGLIFIGMLVIVWK
ncbi:MAG: EamA family transporter [Ferruginibacter sp.]